MLTGPATIFYKDSCFLIFIDDVDIVGSDESLVYSDDQNSNGSDESCADGARRLTLDDVL